MSDQQFHPPSPGSWELETTHIGKPITRYMADSFPAAIMRGMTEGNRHYGSLMNHIEFTVINGFVYGCPRFIGAPKEPKGPPPKIIFKLLTWFHPEIRRRLRRSREVFTKKLWREDLARWDTEWKPATKARALGLQKVALNELTVDDLVVHLGDCRELLIDTIRQHHRLNPCPTLPIGDFLSHVSEWTETPTTELMQLFRGTSRVSLGGADEFQALSQALRRDEEAKACLYSGNPASDVLDALLSGPSEVATAFQAYLDVVGYRIATGYDVSDLYVLEMPDIIVSAIRSSLEADDTEEESGQQAERAARVRETVSEEHRSQFDELLKEARLVFRVRDERVLEGDAWATGLTRRALLAAGDRLARDGKLEQASHIVDATHDEIVALLRGQGGPSKDELSRRVQYRTTKTIDDAPARLGPPPVPPPPGDWLPPYAHRSMRAIQAVIIHMFVVRETKDIDRVVTGIPVSPGQYEGTARLVRTEEDMRRIQKGEVLVARMTAPSYGIILPLVGAIVTDRGGLLSHPALVAREYGLPAVVGTNNATKKIADGDRILVDGTKGEVRILS